MSYNIRNDGIHDWIKDLTSGVETARMSLKFREIALCECMWVRVRACVRAKRKKENPSIRIMCKILRNKLNPSKTQSKAQSFFDISQKKYWLKCLSIHEIPETDIDIYLRLYPSEWSKEGRNEHVTGLSTPVSTVETVCAGWFVSGVLGWFRLAGIILLLALALLLIIYKCNAITIFFLHV